MLESYWVNTFANILVRQSLRSAAPDFRRDFDRLIETSEVVVAARPDTSFIELKNTMTLWGLLINSGYLTVTKHTIKRGAIQRSGNRTAKRA
ncbi:MAG: hypothetical protein LBS84_01575 [Clostridiales bacterium]|jgi:hypothetical protein|nr:hypothetical protein [Clostridiales bacterium]